MLKPVFFDLTFVLQVSSFMNPSPRKNIIKTDSFLNVIKSITAPFSPFFVLLNKQNAIKAFYLFKYLPNSNQN